MFKDLISKIGKNLKIILTIILIAIIVYFVYDYIKTRQALADALIEAQINHQNEQAYKDSLNMKADTLQTYAIFIKDLRDENSKIKGQYTFLKSQYTLLLDSIEILNQPVDSIDLDSDKIYIAFSGNQGRISYKGNVTYFILSEKAIHSLSIIQDPIQILSIFQINDTTNLITNTIYADGVLIDNAKTVIDSLIYRKINQPIKLEQDKFYRFNLVSEINQIISKTETNLWEQRQTSLQFGINYYFNRNLSTEVKYDILNKNFNLSGRYQISPIEIFYLVF